MTKRRRWPSPILSIRPRRTLWSQVGFGVLEPANASAVAGQNVIGTPWVLKDMPDERKSKCRTGLKHLNRDGGAAHEYRAGPGLPQAVL